ncbi:MAG: hypothetical protein ACON5H_08645 [Akkermansiaceae bacterium]
MIKQWISKLLVLVAFQIGSALEIVTDDFEGGSLGVNWDAASQATLTAGTGAEGSANFAALAAAGSGDVLGVGIAGGAADVEIDFFVRIRDFGARRFNLMVNNAETVIADGASINLRYQNGGWAAFDSATSWNNLSNLGSLTGEAWHRVRVTCRGWGTPGATFDVEVSDADGTTFTSSQTGLNFYQGGNPDTASVGAVVFTSTWGTSPGYDIDGVMINTLEAVIDDPNISVTSEPPFLGAVLEADPPAQVAGVVVENTGGTNDLVISDASVFSGASAENFSITTILPLTIAPGASRTVQVQFDADGGNGTFEAFLDLQSNDASNPSFAVPVSVFVPSVDGNQFGNADFEESSMALPKWSNSVGTPVATTGFAPGSTTAASVLAGSDLLQLVQGEADWYLEFFIKVQESGARAFNLVIDAGLGLSVNLRLQGTGEFATWDTFVEGEGYGGGHVLPGLTAGETYLMRVIGTNWGGDSPTYTLQLSDPGSDVLKYEVTGIDRYRSAAGSVPTQGPTRVNFTAQYGGTPGFEIDDAKFINGIAPPLPGNADPVIQNFVLDQENSALSFDWNANVGTEYYIYFSTDLQNWVEVEDRLAQSKTETYMEAIVPSGIRFYRVQDYPEESEE